MRCAILIFVACQTSPATNAPATAIFPNLDFENLDADGNLTDWLCECGGVEVACKTDTKDPAQGERDLVLPSGCSAFVTSSAFNSKKNMHFSYEAKGAAIMPMDTEIIEPGSAAIGLYVDGLTTAPSDWTLVPSRDPISTTGIRTLELQLRNSDGANDSAPGDGPDLYIDDVQVVQDAPNPPNKVGAILRATHIDQFHLWASAAPASIYLSLPIDYASQTPLYFELSVTPPEALDQITYASEAENNWGAVLTFANAASDIVVRWDAVALVRELSDGDVPSAFAANGAPEQWLSPSAIIETGDANIAEKASALSGTTPVEKMQAVVDWTAEDIAYHFTGDGLDASTAFAQLQSTCTGYANLAAAMGRVRNIPSRHVTNILLGEAQDMHSLTEFYLGTNGGWRRTEPQATIARVPDDYAFMMRVIMPEDESPIPGRPSVGGGSLILGIPFHALSEILSAPERFAAAKNPIRTFNDSNYLENRADPVSEIRDTTPAAMTALFAAARASWQSDLAAYNAGTFSAARMQIRRQAQNAKTMADVQAILDALQ